MGATSLNAATASPLLCSCAAADVQQNHRLRQQSLQQQHENEMVLQVCRRPHPRAAAGRVGCLMHLKLAFLILLSRQSGAEAAGR